MNEEMRTMFEADTVAEDAVSARAREEALFAKRKADEKFLNECKCFKDFSLGREKELKECADYIAKYMFRCVQLGGVVTTDFVAGVRMCLEMFEELPGKWDRTFEALGKEEV